MANIITSIAIDTFMQAPTTEAMRAAMQVGESPFVSVDTEAQFDAALAAGRSIHLRGEGSGGVIDLTGEKEIHTARTAIEGPGHLRFVGLAADARCLQLWAPDVTLRDFEMSSTFDLASSSQDGINIPALEIPTDIPHRAKLQRLDLHNWFRCLSKFGDTPTPYTDDVLVEDCYLHTFVENGINLWFGLRRLVVRRCRVLAKQTGETHTSTANAAHISSNIEDALIEDCVFGKATLMGLEMTTVPGGVQTRPRVVRTRIDDVGGYGMSLGHAVQAFAENVIVDGVSGIGIEIAGDDVTGRTQDAMLVACDVRNVDDPAGGDTAAYVIDKANDVVLLGCRAKNITCLVSGGGMGVYVVHGAERAAILNCVFMDAGSSSVHLYKGTGPNTSGFHLVQGCTFRHTVNATTQRAVLVNDVNAVVRNNTAFQRPGGTMSYQAACTAGAAVECDSGTSVVSGAFTGSNSIISVPA